MGVIRLCISPLGSQSYPLEFCIDAMVEGPGHQAARQEETEPQDGETVGARTGAECIWGKETLNRNKKTIIFANYGGIAGMLCEENLKQLSKCFLKTKIEIPTVRYGYFAPLVLRPPLSAAPGK